MQDNYTPEELWILIRRYEALILKLHEQLEAEGQPKGTPFAKVSPLEFVTMVLEKEHLVGKPMFWAEWPNEKSL